MIEWSRLFDVDGAPPAQRAKLIDGRLARSLIELPAAITGEVELDAYRSLAGRDLERGHAYGLPSGEAVARAMGEDAARPTTRSACAPPAGRARRRCGSTSWRESASRGRGEQLGPTGGRIVAEVLIGILDADRGSYRASDPDWSPTLASRGETFGLIDLLLEG